MKSVQALHSLYDQQCLSSPVQIYSPWVFRILTDNGSRVIKFNEILSAYCSWFGGDGFSIILIFVFQSLGTFDVILNSFATAWAGKGVWFDNSICKCAIVQCGDWGPGLLGRMCCGSVQCEGQLPNPISCGSQKLQSLFMYRLLMPRRQIPCCWRGLLLGTYLLTKPQSTCVLLIHMCVVYALLKSQMAKPI